MCDVLLGARGRSEDDDEQTTTQRRPTANNNSNNNNNAGRKAKDQQRRRCAARADSHQDRCNAAQALAAEQPTAANSNSQQDRRPRNTPTRPPPGATEAAPGTASHTRHAAPTSSSLQLANSTPKQTSGVPLATCKAHAASGTTNQREQTKKKSTTPPHPQTHTVCVTIASKPISTSTPHEAQGITNGSGAPKP